MKKLLVNVFLLISFMTRAQELPTIQASGYSFQIGCKFTIKLKAVDSKNFNYSVIAFEQFNKTVDTFNHDGLFDKMGNDSTITFYFCYGTLGDTEAEREKNMQVLLIMKNYTKIALKYSSEIQRKQDGEFEPTSNDGAFPGAISMEMWPYAIYTIGLRDFKRLK